MLIRDMIPDDVSSLSKLYFQFWNEESDVEMMRVKFTQIQSNNAYILLCAIEQDQVIGSVMGIICEELYGKCNPFLVVENVIVDIAFRKMGIGKALFTELESRAKTCGCTQVILVTDTNRKEACAFYESLGFRYGVNQGYKKKLQ